MCLVECIFSLISSHDALFSYFVAARLDREREQGCAPSLKCAQSLLVGKGAHFSRRCRPFLEFPFLLLQRTNEIQRI